MFVEVAMDTHSWQDYPCLANPLALIVILRMKIIFLQFLGNLSTYINLILEKYKRNCTDSTCWFGWILADGHECLKLILIFPWKYLAQHCYKLRWRWIRISWMCLIVSSGYQHDLTRTTYMLDNGGKRLVSQNL